MAAVRRTASRLRRGTAGVGAGLLGADGRCVVGGDGEDRRAMSTAATSPVRPVRRAACRDTMPVPHQPASDGPPLGSRHDEPRGVVSWTVDPDRDSGHVRQPRSARAGSVVRVLRVRRATALERSRPNSNDPLGRRSPGESRDAGPGAHASSVSRSPRSPPAIGLSARSQASYPGSRTCSGCRHAWCRDGWPGTTRWGGGGPRRCPCRLRPSRP